MMDNVQVIHQGHKYFILDLEYIHVRQEDFLMLVTK